MHDALRRLFVFHPRNMLDLVVVRASLSGAVRRRISVEGSAHTPEQIGGSGGAERTLSISEFGRHCGAYRASALAPEELFRRLGEASASRDCCACPDRAAATPVRGASWAASL